MSNATTKTNIPFGWSESASREKKIMLQELAQVVEAVNAMPADTEAACNKLDEMRAELATVREMLGLCDEFGDDITGTIDYE